MKRKTTITLTIAGLLGVAGALYSASFFSLDLDPQGASGPLGVAASQTDLYASDYCTATGVPFRNIKKIDCDGVATVVTAIPTIPGCEEMYMAIAPSVSAIAGFTPRDVFITNGILIYRFTPPTPPNPPPRLIYLRRSQTQAAHRTIPGLRSTMSAQADLATT